MNLTRVDTIVQFTQGSATVWTDPNVAVPTGAVVIDTINKVIKEGDGTTLFANLPICLDYNFSGGTSGAVTPVGDDIGSFAIASNSSYSPSTVKLTDILANITTLNTKAGTQDSRFTAINASNLVLAVSPGTVDGTIVVCSNGKYGPGIKTLAQLISDLIASGNAAGTSMHITDLVWYSDSGLVNQVMTPNDITENNTYWCVISGLHDTAELRTVDFSMSTQTAGITITNTEGLATCAILASTYGGTGDDLFTSVAIDALGNIFCCGYTASEGPGSPSNNDSIIIKYDPNLNILVKFRLTGASSEGLQGITIDSSNNVIVVGNSWSEVVNSDYAIVIKLDNNLSILFKKRIGVSGQVTSFGGVDTDSSNNIYCVGTTFASGVRYDGIILKFDSSLNLLIQKYYYGTIKDTQFYCPIVDSLGNIIVVGNTASEGQGGVTGDALIIRFDSSLNILARKIYGGTLDDIFYSAVVDKSGNIFCVGYTTSEGSGANDGLIVKFDSNLNILVKKRYGGTNGESFNNITLDSFGNVIVVGLTGSEGLGSYEGLIIKFDTNLNIITRKIYGGTGDDRLAGVAVDALDNIICVGQTYSGGAGSRDCLVVKLPSNIPSGSFTGTVLTGMTLADSGLTLSTSNLTLTNSGLTLAVIGFVNTDSILTAATSNLTQKLDTISVARYNAPTKLLTTIYSSTYTDQFLATAIDTDGNIVCVGSSTVSGQQNGLIVKLSNAFVPIARKLFTGNYSEVFNSVVTGTSNNIYCVGTYKTTSTSAYKAFIVKFDSTLATIMSQKSFGGSGDDIFYDVIRDTAGSIFAVGYTTSEGSGIKDALIVKFDSALTIIYKKRYGGAGNDIFYSVALDASGNVICVGSTTSEGATQSALIMKLDANLNIILRKIYNSTGNVTEFLAVVVSTANFIYCVGDIANNNYGLIVKFDTNLNVLINRISGKPVIGKTSYTGVWLDSNNNVIACGFTNTEGAGGNDMLVVKFSSSLDIVSKKLYGSVSADAEFGCIIDSNNDIIVAGYGTINANTDAIVTKIPGVMTTGVYTNKFFNDMILSDSKLTVIDDNATVVNSNLAIADSTSVAVSASMILSDATGAIVTDTTIMDATPNVFKVVIGQIVTSGNSVSPTFNVSTNDGATIVTKNITVNVNKFGMLVSLYGGTYDEFFNAVVADASGNIFCAGSTASEGSLPGTYADALIVKFDSSLNIIAKKRYGGTGDDQFNGVVIDTNGNIIVAGWTSSEGLGGNDALVVKFDSNLNILAKKRYGGINNDYFYGVAVDSLNNIICAGLTSSEGTGSFDTLVVKFDSNLNILSRKIYGGSTTDMFNNVTTDTSDNIICVGSTGSEGSGTTECLVVKFDSSLNILACKIYGGAGIDEFYAVGNDSSNNIICVGYTYSEGSGSPAYCDALIVKFDSSLNILARKIYGGAGNDVFSAITVDSNNNIICVGSTLSEGLGGKDGLIVKFDNNLNILAKKRYGGSGTDRFADITIDAAGNIYRCGYTTSDGAGGNDAFVIKITPVLPSGTFTGNIISKLTLTDSNLTLADSNLTLANSALTLATSATTVADSALTLSASTLTQKYEAILP